MQHWGTRLSEHGRDRPIIRLNILVLFSNLNDSMISNYQNVPGVNSQTFWTEELKPPTSNAYTYLHSLECFWKGLQWCRVHSNGSPWLSAVTSAMAEAISASVCLLAEVTVSAVHLTMRCAESSTTIAEFQVELVEHYQLNVFWSKRGA